MMSIHLNIRYHLDVGAGKGVKKEESLTVQASRLEVPVDVCKEIHGRIGHKLKEADPLEYGLYSPSKKTWLQSHTFFGKVKIPSGSDLCYKAKKRLIRIRFLDGTTKIINVDETKYVKELTRDICEQLKIDNADELSLLVAGDYAVSQHHPAMPESPRAKAPPKTLGKLALRPRSESWGYHLHPTGSPQSPGNSPNLRRKTLSPTGAELNGMPKPSPPMSPGQRRKITNNNNVKTSVNHKRKGSFGSWRKMASPLKKQLSKRHQIRIDTPWLDPNKTLAAQEVTEDDDLILMYRFFYHMELTSDSVNMEMLFKQARATYLAGELLCSAKDMIQFTAVLCQIYKGDVDDKFCLETLLKIQHQVAPPKWKIKGYYKSIVADYAALKGMTVPDGKCCFIKLWSSLELFGFEFLSCSEAKTSQRGLIGISKDKILFLSNQKAAKAETWEFDDLLDCKQDILDENVTLYFKRDRTLQLCLPEYSGVLIDCIEGHRDLQSTVPMEYWHTQSFHFDQSSHGIIAPAYNFASQFAKDRERCALSKFTYEDIFRGAKTFNPLFSDEEVDNMECPWENPLFENTDQLMDERFSFLDLKEYADDVDNPMQHKEVTNGKHLDFDDSDADTDTDSSDDELLEIQPVKTDVKLARRISKDQQN